MNENKHGSRESYHPRIGGPKHGQTGNMKPLNANRSLSFAVKWPNLELKVSNGFETTGTDIFNGRL